LDVRIIHLFTDQEAYRNSAVPGIKSRPQWLPHLTRKRCIGRENPNSPASLISQDSSECRVQVAEITSLANPHPVRRVRQNPSIPIRLIFELRQRRGKSARRKPNVVTHTSAPRVSCRRRDGADISVAALDIERRIDHGASRLVEDIIPKRFIEVGPVHELKTSIHSRRNASRYERRFNGNRS